MRSNFWKKGVSITLAAMMMATPLPITNVLGTGTAIVKADEGSKTMPDSPTVIDGMIYATVNMKYADFYYGEVNNIENKESFDLSKGDIVKNTYTNGEYDAVTSATTEKSVQYAATYFDTGVVNDETGGEATGVTTYGVKDVQIAIPETLYQEFKEHESDEAYQNLPVYEYLKDANYSDTAFDEYKELNGDGTFKATKSEPIVKDAGEAENAATITSSSQYGNWQIDLNKPFYPDYISPRSMQGVVIETSDGAKYGMLHGDNLWVNTGEMAFAAQEWQVHGQNHIAYAHTSDLSGKTIVKITYLLSKADAYTEGEGGRHETKYPACDGKDIVFTNLNLYCKKVSDTKVSVENAVYNAAGTKVQFNFTGTPSDAAFKVGTVKKGSGRGAVELSSDQYSYNAETGVLTLNKDCTADAYSVSFVSDKYTDVSASFNIENEPVKSAQNITTKVKDGYTAVYGAKAFHLGASAATALTYTSSNTKAVSVDAKGNVTINGVGTAVITIQAAESDTYKAASKTIKITVNKAKTSITTAVKSTVSKVYGAKAFSLGAKASAGTTLKYTTSNKKTAVVSAKGNVTIKGTGTAVITITASGANYNTAVKKITVKVSPKKQTVKLKAGKKKLAIRWKKDTKASGYQIKVGTKKNLSGAKTYTVKSYKTYKKTVSKLKSKKKYYVKVRAYKTVGKTKLYGAYSAVKSVKVK